MWQFKDVQMAFELETTGCLNSLVEREFLLGWLKFGSANLVMTFSSMFIHILKFSTFPDTDCDSTNGKHFFFFIFLFLKVQGISINPPQIPNFINILYFFLHWSGSIIHHYYLTFSCGHFAIKILKIVSMCRKVKEKFFLSHKAYFPWLNTCLISFFFQFFLQFFSFQLFFNFLFPHSLAPGSYVVR